MLNFLFGFQGRIRRTHFFFGSVGVSFVGCLLGLSSLAAMNIDFSDGFDDISWSGPSPLSALVLGVVGIAVFWSLLALTVKRWHDVGVTGWFSILSLPMISHGAVFLLLCFLPGTESANRYGSDPRGRIAPSTAALPA